VLLVLLLPALLCACSRPAERETKAHEPKPAPEAGAIERDRPQVVVMPLAPPGTGEVTVARVAPLRAELDVPLPPAEPGDPDSLPRSTPAAGDPALKPPIARGLHQILRAGRGGSVTLDVRVDEEGQVSDVEVVTSDADSLTIAAATAAAYATRYHPAMRGESRVAVWCRQVFDVKRGR
jgi:TonB family protein